MLAGKREFVGNIMAGGLGIVTPFCSCSAVPLFIGFVETGVPLGVTFTFLIAAPMINEVALVLLFGMFGWKVAALYIVTGLTIAIASGWVIGRLKLERYIEGWVHDIKMGESGDAAGDLKFADRIRYGLTAVKEIVGKVWPYVLAGIAVGAAIHGYVPEGLDGFIHGEGCMVGGTCGSPAWSPHVFQCGRHHSDNASAHGEGRSSGHDTCLYDGGHRPISAGNDNTAKSA